MVAALLEVAMLELSNIVPGAFTPVLAKQSKSFSLIVTAKVVIYEVFVEGRLEAPKHLARTVHDLYFEPKYEEFRSRPIWSFSNAFTSAFKEAGANHAVQGDCKIGRVSGVPIPPGEVRTDPN